MVTWSLLKLRNFDSYLMTLRDIGHVLELLLYPENIWAKNFAQMLLQTAFKKLPVPQSGYSLSNMQL